MPMEQNRYTCETVRAFLDEYLAGELLPDASAAVARHLESCEGCRRERDELKAIRALMHSARTEAPAELSERVMRAVHEEHMRAKWTRRIRMLSACAAALIVAVGVFASVRGGLSGQDMTAPHAPDTAGVPAVTNAALSSGESRELAFSAIHLSGRSDEDVAVATMENELILSHEQLDRYFSANGITGEAASSIANELPAAPSAPSETVLHTVALSFSDTDGEYRYEVAAVEQEDDKITIYVTKSRVPGTEGASSAQILVEIETNESLTEADIEVVVEEY